MGISSFLKSLVGGEAAPSPEPSKTTLTNLGLSEAAFSNLARDLFADFEIDRYGMPASEFDYYTQHPESHAEFEQRYGLTFQEYNALLKSGEYMSDYLLPQDGQQEE